MKRSLAVRVSAESRHTPRGSRFAGNGVILSDIIERHLPAFYAGFFCVLAERTELKRFLVVRVSAEPTYAEAHTLAWETALSCQILSKDTYPHFMRDFSVFWRRGQR